MVTLVNGYRFMAKKHYRVGPTSSLGKASQTIARGTIIFSEPSGLMGCSTGFLFGPVTIHQTPDAVHNHMPQVYHIDSMVKIHPSTQPRYPIFSPLPNKSGARPGGTPLGPDFIESNVRAMVYLF